jgi:hypothetical protein
MNTRPAEFLRFVAPDEAMSAVVEEAKGLTYEHFCEIALLELEGGKRVLVRGGPYGIDLQRSISGDALGRQAEQLWVDVAGAAMRVTWLFFHTHPKPTGGPSDGDLLVLELLGQDVSTLYELSGPPEGTKIRPKRT